MVDCRPAAGAPPHEIAANGGAPPPPQTNENNHQNQSGGSGDTGPPPAARATTPATPAAAVAYTGVPMNPPMNMGGYSPYYGGGKGAGGAGGGAGAVVWMGPAHAPAPAPAPMALGTLPPPPQHVNPHVLKSMQLNGSDLPMNDIPTLRYYFNLGVECMWAAYGPPAPPRHYSPRDIAQDMQQMSLQERGGAGCGGGGHEGHKKPQDKPLQHQNKGNGQRSLLGPRFNKRNNQDGNQNPNHTQNKGHNNNNMANKGPNNRRNSHESRPTVGHNYGPPLGGEGECVVEAPILSVPYLPYPPPVYPIQYYPVDSDPGMMGMIGGMGYVNYEEGAEYVQPYYPHPLYPPPPPPHPHPHAPGHIPAMHPHHMSPHQEHK